MKYILAHDLGTSGNKATLYDEQGTLVKSEVASYPTAFFSGNRAEQDPEDWWNAVCLSTRRLLDGIDAASIAAVSFSGHMMGCLPVDKDGRPLRKHILYCDSRAAEQTQKLVKEVSPWECYSITGHRPSAVYTAEKVMWMRDNEPDLYRKTHCVLNPKDYIILRLTDQFVTDFSDAGGTQLFDINAFEWSERMADAAGIDLEKFPKAYTSAHVAGEVTKHASAQTGIPAGTPVCCGAGDGCAAGVGAGSLTSADTYTCIGSSGWVGATSSKPMLDPRMRAPVFPHAVPGLYHSCGAMQTAGASFAWAAREVFGAGYEGPAGNLYERMDAEIGPAGPGSHGIIFLPYLMGERSPWWDDAAKGCFLGVTQQTTRGDMLRAVQEGVAFNLRIVLGVYKDYLDIEKTTMVGGGAKSEIWRGILSDVYNLPINVPVNIEECASMGAAVIGAVGVGLLPDFDAAMPLFRTAAVREPNPENAALYDERFSVFVDSYLALRDLFPRL